MFRKQDDIEAQMRVLRVMGHARLERGEYDRAIKHHHECLNLALALKNKRLAAIELNNLGECYQFMWNMARALDYHTRSLAMRNEVGIDPGPDVIRNLGVDLVELGQFAEGMAHLHDALQRARAQGNADFIMQSLASLGNAHLTMNEPAQAAQVGQELLEMAEQVGSATVRRAQALYILGRAALAQQRIPEAHTMFQNGLFAAQASRSSGALLWDLHAALGEASPSPMLAEVHFRIAADLIMQTTAAIEEDSDLRRCFLDHPHIHKILNRAQASG
jgi:tetratricopeptide (TPR) repeat protein